MRDHHHMVSPTVGVLKAVADFTDAAELAEAGSVIRDARMARQMLKDEPLPNLRLLQLRREISFSDDRQINPSMPAALHKGGLAGYASLRYVSAEIFLHAFFQEPNDAVNSIDNAFTAKASPAAPRPDLCRRAVLHAAEIHQERQGRRRRRLGHSVRRSRPNRPGARFGPQAIRRASAIFDNDPQYPFDRDLFEEMATSTMATACSTMAITRRPRPPSSARRRKS